MAQEFEDDTNPQQLVDVYHDLVETIQFGSVEDGAQKFRTAFQQAEADRRLDAEKESAKQQIADFAKTRPHLSGNDMATAAITRQVVGTRDDKIRGHVWNPAKG
jgi:hypothetical protein